MSISLSSGSLVPSEQCNRTG